MALRYTSGDLEVASAILVASAQALEERGQGLWPPASLTPDKLRRYYPPGTWRVAWLGDVPAACYTLLDSDPLFWPGDPPGHALYLHKVAVHPDHQGHGLAHHLLSEAARETRERRVPWLKLDTATQRPKLRALYEAFGFQSAGQREVRGFDVTLYQWPVPLD